MLDEKEVLVDLMSARARNGDRVGEEPRAPARGEADEPARPPVLAGHGRLERVRQEHGHVPVERTHGVRAAQPARPGSRIVDENVGQPLARQEEGPRAREDSRASVHRACSARIAGTAITVSPSQFGNRTTTVSGMLARRRSAIQPDRSGDRASRSRRRGDAGRVSARAASPSPSPSSPIRRFPVPPPEPPAR